MIIRPLIACLVVTSCAHTTAMIPLTDRVSAPADLVEKACLEDYHQPIVRATVTHAKFLENSEHEFYAIECTLEDSYGTLMDGHFLVSLKRLDKPRIAKLRAYLEERFKEADADASS